ncbi:aryl hydrocarbon receptor nuclear translocator homolog isoform X3 [Paramacrobiotus metropolitanus]|nr:aryl hydrocarbon receptor nuclear translocator homolog isoform X3 [Paramacrobiotus metropolitanus]XP_055338118.1 aryl hydrocarbon receptor nuclear translocator homolog isoform X3 [Paramacrobiotus metropolitanus]XP_055338119.1 aryl hydrocarbon receptor nuclear translocator homolog isoform X3 [Paramacrobiotus metropolitanus]XP_055338120.1 aryl hydrocarbon receptor nuclear translocator homolog isoform X3 [Paramacrobiotus metropolitanus]XP_055338121.1 aryl hydrocarbon receptor nuclear translocat
MEEVESIQDKERYARENHSEIERRRRNKMTAYITELSDMVPTCSALARKPDKLTILRMAVAHMKTLRGTGNTDGNNYKPSFLTDQELKHLILEAADGFLFIVACDPEAHIMYLSDSTTAVLNQPYAEWTGASFFDLIHPEDHEKVREQLQSQESQTSGRILDLKTGTIRKEGHQSSMRVQMGSRRSFICRMLVGNATPDAMYLNSRHYYRMRHRASLGPSADGRHYVVVHCSGYVKNWSGPGGNSQREAAADMDEPSTSSGQNQSSGNCVLVAIGRLQMTSIPNTSDLDDNTMPYEFVTRHSADGNTLFVDPRITPILQFLPTDVLGKPLLDMVHPEDQKELAECFDMALKAKGQPAQKVIRFKTKNGDYDLLRSVMYAFLNPYSDELEFVVGTHSSVKALQQQETMNNAVMAGVGPTMDHSVHTADHSGSYAGHDTSASSSMMPSTSGSRAKPYCSSSPSVQSANSSLPRSANNHGSIYGHSSTHATAGTSRASNSAVYMPSSSYQADTAYPALPLASQANVAPAAWPSVPRYDGTEAAGFSQPGHSAYSNMVSSSLYPSSVPGHAPFAQVSGRSYTGVWPQQQAWNSLPTGDAHIQPSSSASTSGSHPLQTGEDMADYYRNMHVYDPSSVQDMSTAYNHYPDQHL